MKQLGFFDAMPPCDTVPFDPDPEQQGLAARLQAHQVAGGYRPNLRLEKEKRRKRKRRWR